MYRFVSSLCLAILCVAHVASCSAQQTKDRDVLFEWQTVDAAVHEQIRQQGLVGVCIGIIQDGKVVGTKGYGFEDRENSIPASDKTMFRWASISKPVTAVAAMQLLQQGKLDLNADVRTYVPEYPDQGDVIRVRDLMCHQSGIVHYTNGRVIKTKREYEADHPFESVMTALDTFKESPLVHVPGEKYDYSTHAFILLSAIVERAGDQRFSEQVEERICQPLNLTTLQPDYQWIDIPNRAVGYRKSRRSGQPVMSTNTDVSWKLGGGGFISTVGDLAGFAAGLLGDELINLETKKQMWTAQSLKDGSKTDVGLGVFVNDETVSHNGSQEKTRTRMVIWPESRSGIVVMSNSEYANVGRVMTAVKNALEK